MDLETQVGTLGDIIYEFISLEGTMNLQGILWGLVLNERYKKKVQKTLNELVSEKKLYPSRAKLKNARYVTYYSAYPAK
ncbi:MAG: hypothetical protein AABX28_00320 [Nanoarchaeota archaeon]